MVEGMLTDGPITPVVLPRVLALGVDVNGLLLQPSPAPDIFEAIEDCGAFRADGDPDGACTVTATGGSTWTTRPMQRCWACRSPSRSSEAT